MGASSGIGLELAEIFASRGVKVGMAARHTETMRAMREKYPELIEYASIDITHRDAPGKLEELAARLGGMDIYIHVSGIGFENLSLNPEREADIVKTNAGGFARMVCAAYRYFRKNRRAGQIAAITSVAGTKGIGRLAAYSASKTFGQHYLTALEQLARAEQMPVTFTDIRPGWVRTPLLDAGEKYPLEMDVDYAARHILKAIVRKERVAVIDWRWNIIVGLWRLIPNALWIRMDMKLSSPDAPLPPTPPETPVQPAPAPTQPEITAPEA